MSKKSAYGEGGRRPERVARPGEAGSFIMLRDGRKIVESPGGGKVSKRDVERAVRSVAARREGKSSASRG